MSEVTRRGGLPGPRRRAQPRRRPRRPALSAGDRRRSSRSCPAWPRPPAKLRDAGFLLIGATNQPDVARGTQRREVVEAMNARLLAATAARRDPGLLRGRRRLPAAASPTPACCSRRPRPTPSTCRPATWSATAGATSRPAAAPAAGPSSSIAATASDDADPPADHDCRGLVGRRGLDPFRPGTKDDRMTKLADLKVKIFADGADRGGMLELYSNPHDQGVHHQPDPDAQRRHHRLRGVRARGRSRRSPTGRSRWRSSPTTSPRWSAQAPTDRVLGRERLRQDPGDQHPGRVGGAAGPPLAAAGREAERHGADDPGPGARRRRRPWAARPPACVSVFAGRVADTGRDPVPMMAAAVEHAARRIPSSS